MSLPPSVAELINQSRAKDNTGELVASLELAKQALAAAQAAGTTEGTAAALICLSTVHFRLGHYGQARDLASESLSCGAETPLRAEALLLLGMCATESADLVAGERFYHQAIDLSRQAGDYRTLVRALHSMAAGVYMPRGQFDLSLTADQESLRIAREHGILGLERGPLIMMAWVFWRTGQRSRAWAVLEELSHVIVLGAYSFNIDKELSIMRFGQQYRATGATGTCCLAGYDTGHPVVSAVRVGRSGHAWRWQPEPA